MDAILGFLSDWGYWGMLISAFLAGSFFPLIIRQTIISFSEAIMLSLLAAGLQPFPLVVYGTIGNVAGSLFNYGVGHMGNVEWIERYLHVSKEKLDKAEKFMGGHGAWMGFFAFIPLLGSAITILLGLMKANFFISLLSITIGKFGRYLILVYGAIACFK